MTSRAIGSVATLAVLVWTVGAQGAASAQDARPVAYRVHSSAATSSYGAEVILQGDRARITYDEGEERNPIARQMQGEFELWLDGGARQLAVDHVAQTYYDRAHYRAHHLDSPVKSATLGVFRPPQPATVESVADMRVNVRTDPKRIDAAGLSCVHVVLEVSYRLNLTLLGTRFPATVQATAAYDVTDSLPVARLPFDHGTVSLVTGEDAVDRAIAERLAGTAGAAGISVKTVIQARRQIESSPATEETLEEVLENFREVKVPPGTFDLPTGLRFQEPVMVGPARK
jgi:hypothetical protein